MGLALKGLLKLQIWGPEKRPFKLSFIFWIELRQKLDIKNVKNTDADLGLLQHPRWSVYHHKALHLGCCSSPCSASETPLQKKKLKQSPGVVLKMLKFLGKHMCRRLFLNTVTGCRCLWKTTFWKLPGKWMSQSLFFGKIKLKIWEQKLINLLHIRSEI